MPPKKTPSKKREPKKKRGGTIDISLCTIDDPDVKNYIAMQQKATGYPPMSRRCGGYMIMPMVETDLETQNYRWDEWKKSKRPFMVYAADLSQVCVFVGAEAVRVPQNTPEE